MNENAHNDDLTPDKAQILNLVVKRAARLHAKAFERPSDKAIADYLDGTASELQISEVQNAMVASEEFRLIMLEAAREFEAFRAPENREVTEPASPESLPSFDEFYKKNEARIVGRPIAVGNSKSTGTNLVQRVLPWAIAATMTLVVAWQGLFKAPVTPSFIPIAVSLPVGVGDPGRFSGTSPRSSDSSGEKIVFQPTSYNAAVDALSQRVRFEKHKYELIPETTTDSTIISGKQFLIMILNPDRGILGQSELTVPLRVSENDSLQLWYMTIPSGQLYSTALEFDTLAIGWPNLLDAQAAIVVTQRQTKGFVSVPGTTLTIDLKSR